MITLEHLLQNQRPQILEIAAKYNASNVRVFGSVVRGENTPNSDVDFLVEMPPGQSLLKIQPKPIKNKSNKMS